MQPGRFLFPMDEKSSQGLALKWRSAPLLKKPLVEEAILTQTRDLIQIEDASPNALPATTYLETHINPPEKHQQIGVDASRKLLRGFLQGLEPPTGARCAVLIVDLSLHTCDFLKAASMDHMLGNTGMSTYYLGFGAGDDKLEWAGLHIEEFLSTGFLEGSLSIPKSVSLPPPELPQEMVESSPAQPQLNVLTWNNKVKYNMVPTLKTPASLLTQYHDHPRFATEFRSLLEQSRVEYPLDMTPDDKAKDKEAKCGRAITLGVSKTDSGMAPASATQGKVELKVSWQ